MPTRLNIPKCLQDREILHGLSNEPEYIIWRAVLRRCYDEKNDKYEYYGGSGAKVCDEWRYSFEAFYLHLGPRPSKRHSIDRYPDKKGNYEPGNVRWATWEEQQRNRSSNSFLTLHGETCTVAEWAERLGIDRRTLAQRKLKGWSDDRICSPVQRRGRNVVSR